MSNKTTRPLDIVDVKAGIRAGRLFVQIKDNRLLLGDYQTGESVSLSDIEVKAVVHAKWMLDSSFYSANIYHCTACNTKQMQTSKFCPECGAKMDGEDDEAD